jgi:hypothetical protein
MLIVSGSRCGGCGNCLLPRVWLPRFLLGGFCLASSAFALFSMVQQEAIMLAMTELIGVPAITLGGSTDEQIIGNLMTMIGLGAVMLGGLYVLLRLTLPGALARKVAKAAERAERQKLLNS